MTETKKVANTQNTESGPHLEMKATPAPITDVPGVDITRLLNPVPGKRQSMRGFEEKYVDIVDYIVRITHEIWEEKQIGRIYDTYAHNILIHTTDGQTYGRDKVIADSIKTMAAFPDVRLYADDVIWCGNDEDGFHSSHRIIWVAHNTGYSVYGPPTGKRVVRQGIAHCFVKDNRVVEEWICRDELAVIRQLGFDEIELARKLAAVSNVTPHPLSQGEIERLQGQAPPPVLSPEPGDGFDVEDFVRRSIHEIWNWRLLNKVDDYYASNVLSNTSTNKVLYGRGDLKSHILSLLAAFPDAAMSVDHICRLGNEQDGYRVATRWTLQGTHQGPGIYGDPTGKRIRLMGITHQLIQSGKVVREWTAFDEFALLKQIYAPEAEAQGLREGA
jgi:predicted ester cyclase